MQAEESEIAYDSEGHVLLAVHHAAGTLLRVPGRELVADLRYTHGPHTNLHEPVALLVHRYQHLRANLSHSERDSEEEARERYFCGAQSLP